MYVQNVIKHIYGQPFYVFNHTNTVSNGMPIYGQTVQYIWSKCAANKLWSSLVSVLECHTNAHMHDNTFGTKLDHNSLCSPPTAPNLIIFYP